MKQLLLKLDKTGIILFCLLNALVLWLYSTIGSQASGNYYDLSLLVIGVSIPSFIIFFLFLNRDPKKSLYLFILVFPVFPAINNYLGALGSKITPALVELLISFLIFLSISLKYNSSYYPKPVVYFSLFWLASNTSSFLVSDYGESATVGYVLSFAFIFMLLALSKILFLLRQSEGLNFYKTPLFVFYISFIFYVSACFMLLISSYGFEVFQTITQLKRLDNFSGIGYLDINTMSGVSLLLVPLALFYISTQKLLTYRLFHLISIFLVILLVFIDKSRGGLLSFIFIVGWLIFTNLLPTLNKTYGDSGSRVFSIILFGSVALISLYLIGDIIFFRFSGTSEETATAVTFADVLVRTFVSTRGQLLVQGFLKFLDSPLFGHGYGTMLYYAALDVNWDSHNQILESLISIGLFGTGTLFYLLISAYLKYKKNKKLMRSELILLQKYIWLSLALFGLFGLTTGLHFLNVGTRISFLPLYLYSFFLILSIHISDESIRSEQEI